MHNFMVFIHHIKLLISDVKESIARKRAFNNAINKKASLIIDSCLQSIGDSKSKGDGSVDLYVIRAQEKMNQNWYMPLCKAVRRLLRKHGVYEPITIHRVSRRKYGENAVALFNTEYWYMYLRVTL